MPTFNYTLDHITLDFPSKSDTWGDIVTFNAPTTTSGSMAFYESPPTLQAPTKPKPKPDPRLRPVPLLHLPAAVHVAGTTLTRAQAETIIATLEAAKGTACGPHLATLGHPDLDYRAAAGIEIAYNPSGPRHTKLALISYLRRLLDPHRSGPFTRTPLGYLAPPVPPDIEQHNIGGGEYLLVGSTASIKAEIRRVAKSIGHGRIVGRGVTEYSAKDAADWWTAWQQGDLARCYTIEKTYAHVHPAHPGHPYHPQTHQVVWAPAVEGEIPAGIRVPGDWPSPDYYFSGAAVETYLVRAGMAHPTYLNVAQRSRWATAHLRGDKKTVDEISLMAKGRHDSNKLQRTIKPHCYGVGPHPHYKELLTSTNEGKAHPRYWSIGNLYAYAHDHQLTLPPYWFDQVSVVDAHRHRYVIDLAADALKLVLTYAPDQPALSGYHRKAVLTDQHGRTWIFKPAPDGKRFRSDTEHEAHALARAWGYPTAESHLVTFDGHYGQLQAMLPVTGNLLGLTGPDLADLEPDQLIAIVREHVLDWALDNDDAHGENIVITSDGQTIGIDKGRAWRYFGGWPGLSGDKQANTNCQLIYTVLYDAIADGHLPRPLVDTLYRSALAQARRMQRLPDATVEAHIRRAVEHRPHYQPSSYQHPIPDAPTNADELVTAATARKNNLLADITTLWQRIYARAGWQPPTDDPHALFDNPQGHRLYTGLHDPELPAAVARSKSYGTATFVAGRDVEDATVLLWRERRPDGGYNIRGQLKARGDAATALSAWCAERATDGDLYVHVPCEDSYYQHIQLAANALIKPDIDSYHYQSAMENLGWIKHELVSQVKRINLLKGSDPQPKMIRDRAYLVMADLYLAHIAAIEEMKTKRKPTAVDCPRWTYQPPPPPPPGPDGITVARSDASRAAAHLSNYVKLAEDGELQLSGEVLRYTRDNGNFGHTGYMYLITLPTGEQIEYRDKATEAAYAFQGQVRFTVPDTLDLTDALKRIDTQLTTMGLTLRPADAVDLELFYWRHLAGIMNNRQDSRCPGHTVKSKEFWKRANLPAAPVSREEELKIWRHAFAVLTSAEQIADFLAADAHLPHFGHYDLRRPAQAGGMPYWNRFDVTAEHCKTKSRPSLYYKTGPLNMVRGGGALSTEARVRALAIWKSGQSSTEDLKYGGGGFVFTRINFATQGTRANVFFRRRTLLRTSNYSFAGDLYGKCDERPIHAHFDFDTMNSHIDNGNEYLIKDAISLLDEVEFMVFESEDDRVAALHHFTACGVHTIRGIPVALRCINRYDKVQRGAILNALAATDVI